MDTLYVRDLFGEYVPADTDTIIKEAKRRLATKFRRGALFTSPGVVREAIHLKLAEYEHEVFARFFLDNQHRVILFAELFHGTIDGASVYPLPLRSSSATITHRALRSRARRISTSRRD